MLAQRAYAAIKPELPEGVPLSSDWEKLGNILSAAVAVVFYVGIAICLIFMIIGGIKYATSGGDEKQMMAARGTITNAIIGFVVVVGFRFLIDLVIKFLGGAGIPTGAELIPTTW